ncbi:MAG TPA: hypothetical protein VLJ59_00220 [Mycobacteriales bacterium]|nr:hypothetical protein [Mycobacteriales bacterium]
MILLSLALVLISLGLLIAGLAGASQDLVWASIIATMVAGGCVALVLLRRRMAGGGGDTDEDAETAVDAETDEDTEEVVADERAASPRQPSGTVARDTAEDAPAPSRVIVRTPALPMAPAEPPGPVRLAGRIGSVVDEPTVKEPPAGRPIGGEPVGGAPPGGSYPELADEPPEEDVSARDALRVMALNSDVYVVDGRPRYHLRYCRHLAGREAVALPIPEARDTGFTPCSRCRPDASLAARAREGIRVGRTTPGGGPTPGGRHAKREDADTDPSWRG